RATSQLYGGYELFSDPTAALDKSQTHMLFGTRCQEVPTQLVDERILVGLRPLVAEGSNNYGQALVNCVSSSSHADSLIQDKVVVELGTSTFSLAARAMGAAEVVVCHPDEARLRQVEYAHAFLNNDVLLGSGNTDCNGATVSTTFSTKLLRPGEPLPNAVGSGDSSTIIVALTMSEDEHDDPSFSCWDLITEAFQVWQPRYVLIPSPLVPESQLSTFQEQYTESCGIFVVSS
ncbi:MAG: hypothetical protein SGARI_006017, partial [Bacillariaceae sp.]